MSKYSGKCDFRDTLEINFNDNWEDFKKRATVYHYIDTDGNKEELKFNSPSDLIPWYPYIVALGSFEKDGDCVIVLSKDNYLDEQIESFKEHDLLTEFLEARKSDIHYLYELESNKPVEEQSII